MRFLLISLFLSLTSLPAFAADSALPTFGDWVKKCEDPTDAAGVKQHICYAIQTLSNKENGQKIMQVRVGLAPGKKETLMIATLPLGVLLPPGAALFVDGKESTKLLFLVCGREGCTASAQPLSDTVLTAMRKGAEVSIRAYLPNKKVIALPLSMKGFDQAYAAVLAK